MTEPLCLDDLDDNALDRLPFGVVCLSPEGLVERINRCEAERAGVQRWRVLGRHYIREVAGAALAEQIDAIAPGAQGRVFHTFQKFSRYRDDAVIDVSRCPGGRVTLCIRPTTRPM